MEKKKTAELDCANSFQTCSWFLDHILSVIELENI